MNGVDALVLALLAVGDLALIVHFRRARMKRLQIERMMRSLQLAVERENAAAPAMPHRRWTALRRAG